MAISAIFMLVIGVYAVSTSQGNVEKESIGVGDINESIERMDKEIDEGEAVKDEREIDGEINLVGTKRDSCKIFEEESKNVEIRNMLVDAREADAYTVQINPLRANDSQQGDTHHMKKLTLIDDDSIDGLSLQKDNIRNNSCNDKNLKKEKSSFQYLKEYSGAYFLCISVGFCDGALLVPFKLSSYGTTDSDGILEVFRYLASFGISSILVSPILFFFYCLFINQRRVPCFYFRTAFLPGVSSGVLWAAANFLSVHATYYLGKLRTC